MMTARARMLLVMALTGSLVGIATRQYSVSVLSLSVVLWIAGEWLLFRIRSEVLVRRLRVEREVGDERGTVRTLWAGRTFHVKTRLSLGGWLHVPYALWCDRVPSGVDRVSGEIEFEGAIHPRHTRTVEYVIRPTVAGVIRFEGVSVRIADLQGFFYAEHFVVARQLYRVLPSLVRSGAVPQQVKRYNLLPPPGKHRHLRPGTGSELLQLRDYVPGDPLKSIAWRVSAKRDRLMSKDFESEVPVRCTLFLDQSNSVRIGHPGPTALGRFVELAAAISQLALAERDPVGLCIFDEHASRMIEPGAGRRQANMLLGELADAAARAPTPVQCPLHEPLARAYALCEELYPTLLRRSVNGVPFRLFPLRPSRRLEFRRRAQVATILAEYFNLGPLDPIRMIYDDRFLADWSQRFLGEHHVGYHGPLYDERGRYLFAAPGKIDVLTRALTRAVRKGHDNELFVILADVLELSEHLGPLLTATKVALARHHKVVILSAWPPGLDLPERVVPGFSVATPMFHKAPVESQIVDRAVPGSTPASQTATVPSRTTQTTAAAEARATWARSWSLFRKKQQTGDALAVNRQVLELVRQADQYRYAAAYAELRRSMGRLRVPVICAAESRATRLILDELDLLRTARGRR